MGFVLHPGGCALGHRPLHEAEAALEGLAERLRAAAARSEQVWVGADLAWAILWADLDLWTLTDGGVDRDLCYELISYVDQAPKIDDDDAHQQALVEGPSAAFAHPPWESETGTLELTWAYLRCLTGTPTALLHCAGDATHTVTRPNGPALAITGVSTEAGHRGFWRSTARRDGQRSLEGLAPHAWPDLYFVPGVWREVDDFEGGYAGVNRALHDALDALDTNGAWAMTAAPPALRPSEPSNPGGAYPPNQLIEERLRGLRLDAAPEKPNVYADPACRKVRERKVGSQTLYCEWHVKLEPHRNRVHFHRPTSGSDDRLIVAIFHRHLRLPGD